MSNERAFRDSILQVASIAEVCIERRALLPALILIYSGIDTMGWVTAQNPSTSVAERFTAWVDRFMLPAKPLQCTSLDLYAARCGILHSFTADSTLVTAGKAKPVYYAWGKVSSEDFATVAGVAPDRYAFVRAEDLSEAFRLGVVSTVEAATSDPTLSTNILSRSGRFFVSLTADELLGRNIKPEGAA